MVLPQCGEADAQKGTVAKGPEHICMVLTRYSSTVDHRKNKIILNRKPLNRLNHTITEWVS